MEKRKSSNVFLYIGGALLLLFLLFTVLVRTVDVAAIGPLGSSVGFFALNRSVAETLGYHEGFYEISEYLGFVAYLLPIAFAVLGIVQWCTRKKLLRVDADLFALAIAYVMMAACYVLFEVLTVNFRPVLMDGVLEASYPSSHTLLAIVLFGTAILQVLGRLGRGAVKYGLTVLFAVLLVLTVVFRLLSGVHWITDIIGGVLLGAGIVFLYGWLAGIFRGRFGAERN